MDAKNAAFVGEGQAAVLRNYRTVLVIEADGTKRIVWCIGDFPVCRRTCMLVRKRRDTGQLYECDGEICRAVAR